MCKTLAQGGQRCPSHTGPAWANASAKFEEAVASGDMDAVMTAQERWEKTGAEYASTDEGHEALAAMAAEADANGDYDTAAMLNTVVRKGEDLRAANAEAAAVMKAIKLSRQPRVPTVRDNLAAQAPALAQPAPPNVTLPPITAAQQEKLDLYDSEFTPLYDKYVTNGKKADEYANWQERNEVEAFHRVMNSRKQAMERLVARCEEADATDRDIAEAVRGARASFVSAPRIMTVADSDQFYKTHTSFANASAVHVGRLLEHPNTGTETVQAVIGSSETETDLMNRALRHPSCTPKMLASKLRAESTYGVDEKTWAHARTFRGSSSAVATTCALKDPDDAEKQQAYRYLLEIPAEDFSAEDRRALMTGLNELQAGGHGQRNLVGNFMTWTEIHGDDADREFFGETFKDSRWPDVSNKARAFLGEEPDTENGGGWFRRRKATN